MHTSLFPVWFTDLVALGAEDLPKNLVNKFQSTKAIDPSLMHDLVNIFGRIHHKQIANYLPSSLKIKLQETLNLRSERFEKLLKLALHALHENQPFNPENLEALDKMYMIPAYSSSSMQDMIIAEIGRHLLSLPMPFQDACRFQCYSLPKIKISIDAQQTDLENSVNAIFQSMISNLDTRQRLSLTLKQEQVLFTRAVIKWDTKLISWGALLFLWVDQLGDPGQEVRKELNLNFNRLLLPNKTQTPSKIQKPLQISFKTFAINSVINVLLQDPRSSIPLYDVLENELRQAFSNSIKAQHDAIYFIDYLHSLIPQDPKPFPLAEAWETLKHFDSTSAIYPFLETSLLFLYCKVKFAVKKPQNKEFLFKAIHQLPKQEKQLYLTLINQRMWTIENFQRPLLKIDDTFMQSTKTRLDLSFQEIGRILLKSTVTIANPKLTHYPLCPYLSFEKHIDLITQIEKDFGFKLPKWILTDLLFFQTATVSTFTSMLLLNQFLRLQIKNKPLDHILLTTECEKQTKLLLESFQFKADKQILSNVFLDQAYDYPIQLLIWLQFVFIAEAKIPEKQLQANIMQKEKWIFFIFNTLCSPGHAFPFKQAVKVLKTFSPSMSYYSFLHTSLLFFHCKVKFSIEDPSQAAAIFNILHALTEEEKCFYDDYIQDKTKWIQENFQRAPFPFDQLMTYTEKYPNRVKDIAHLILRSCMTNASNQNQLPSPYLNHKELLKLLRELEEHLGFLPNSMKQDFLLFQTVSKTTNFYLESFFRLIKKMKDSSFNDLEILSEEWGEIANTLMNSFQNDLHPHFPTKELMSRASSYPLFFMIGLQFSLINQLNIPSPLDQKWLAKVLNQKRDVFCIFNALIKNQQKQFPFQEAAKILESFPSKNNNFLYTALFFFHCKVKFAVDDPELAAFLFESLSHLSEQEKQVYEKLIIDKKNWIYERSPRLPYRMSDKVITYSALNDFPLKEIAQILLKFSITEIHSSVSNDATHSYLSFEQHIKLLKDTKKIFKLVLPISIIHDFLFFQTATPSTQNIIAEKFLPLQKEIIKKYLNTMTLPSETYQKIIEASALLIGSISVNLPHLPNTMSARVNDYPKNMIVFADLLQLVTYPIYFFSFSSFIPIRIENKTQKFEDIDQQNIVELIHSDFPNGPAKFCCWSFDPKTHQPFSNFLLLIP